MQSLFDFIDVGRWVKPGTYRLVCFSSTCFLSSISKITLGSYQSCLVLHIECLFCALICHSRNINCWEVSESTWNSVWLMWLGLNSGEMYVDLLGLPGSIPIERSFLETNSLLRKGQKNSLIGFCECYDVFIHKPSWTVVKPLFQLHEVAARIHFL